MPHIVAFYLGLHCSPITHFIEVSSIQRVNWIISPLLGLMSRSFISIIFSIKKKKNDPVINQGENSLPLTDIGKSCLSRELLTSQI